MDALSLLRQAEKYRRLAKGINDQATLVLLEQMASEAERRARRLQSRERLSRAARPKASLSGA
jgi:hypothetical protein